MSYQIPLKYILPAFVVLVALVVAAWAFGLSPVAALTERDRTEPAASTGSANQLTGLPYDVIQVFGTGTASDVPDLANLSLGVSVTADTVAAAREQAATSMNSVIDALDANGIESKDIQTSHFGVHPQYDWSANERRLQGYNVSNRLNVTVRDTETVGTVIDAVIAAGGNDIEFNYLNFAFSDTAELEKEARQAAVNDMNEKARQLAQFSGRPLGKLLVISETPVADVFGGVREFAFAMAAESGPSTSISVGEDEVTVTVHGVFELR